MDPNSHANKNKNKNERQRQSKVGGGATLSNLPSGLGGGQIAPTAPRLPRPCRSQKVARELSLAYMTNFGLVPASALGLVAQNSAQCGSAQPGIRFDLAQGSVIRSGHIARIMAPGSALLGS